jgi:hypothetical protein
MRRVVKVVVVTTAIIATLLGVWLVFAWHHGPTLTPAASIHLVGYRTFTMSNPDTNVFVYPGRGTWLRAQMVVTNEGQASISYGAWGAEPYGWAKAQTDHGSTNGYLAPPFTGSFALLRPGCAATFVVDLPTNTLQWQCGFKVETASVRERVLWRVSESRLLSEFPEAIIDLVRFLPDRAGPSVEIQSRLLGIPQASDLPTNGLSRDTVIRGS